MKLLDHLFYFYLHMFIAKVDFCHDICAQAGNCAYLLCSTETKLETPREHVLNLSHAHLSGGPALP